MPQVVHGVCCPRKVIFLSIPPELDCLWASSHSLGNVQNSLGDPQPSLPPWHPSVSLSAGCGQESGTRSPSTRRQQGGADRLRCQCHTHDKSRPSPGPNLCSRRPGPNCVQGHKYQTNITTHRIQARNTDHGSPIEKRQSDPPPNGCFQTEIFVFYYFEPGWGVRGSPGRPPWPSVVLPWVSGASRKPRGPKTNTPHRNF